MFSPCQHVTRIMKRRHCWQVSRRIRNTRWTTQCLLQHFYTDTSPLLLQWMQTQSLGLRDGIHRRCSRHKLAGWITNVDSTRAFRRQNHVTLSSSAVTAPMVWTRPCNVNRLARQLLEAPPWGILGKRWRRHPAQGHTGEKRKQMTHHALQKAKTR